MHTWGDIQSIYQLAAGLYIGISGILTIWDDPIEVHRREINGIRSRASNLILRYGDDDDGIRKKVAEFIAKCDAEISNGHSRIRDRLSASLNLIKILSFFLGCYSIFLLYQSAKYSETPMLKYSLEASVGLLVLILVLMAGLFGVSVWLKDLMQPTRTDLDQGYRDLADDVLG